MENSYVGLTTGRAPSDNKCGARSRVGAAGLPEHAGDLIVCTAKWTRRAPFPRFRATRVCPRTRWSGVAGWLSAGDRQRRAGAAVLV